MKTEQITVNLAALLYYQSIPVEKGKKKVSFESLGEEEKKPFKAVAENFILQIDKLNLQLVPRQDEKKKEEIDALLKARLEATVADFFQGIKIWKRDLIPQAELVAKIYQIF